MKMLPTPVVFVVPEALAAHVAPRIARLEELLGEALDAESRYVFALSDFALHTAIAQLDWWRAARASGELHVPLTADAIRALAAEALAGAGEMPGLQRALRRLRNRCQLRIVWRHLAARAALEETTGALSDLADVLMDAALDKVHAWSVAREGMPLGGETGAPQRLVVLALGKLGARELNLSSDVDLIFAYPESGNTERGRTNQQFFVRLGQQLIQALDPITADGFAFRVDMRLRPFGASGPLVMSFAAMIDYFLTQGRDWERYAFIKARAAAGDVAAGAGLLKELRPFVYRRYLDFGAIEALRDMKSRIQAERHDSANLKLGPGGIRDVEFTVQVQQLIWGGRQRELQQSSLLAVLPELEKLDHLAPAAAAELAAGYRFLRDAEHSLQAEADRQTQTLPDTAVSELRLARSLGFDDYAAFMQALEGHRTRIAAVFAGVVGIAATSDGDGLRIWVEPERDDVLAAFGFRDPDAAQVVLVDLIAARDRSSVGSEGRQRLDRLMPVLLEEVRRLDDPDLALARVAPVLKAIMRRSAYLALLSENRRTLHDFLEIASKSRWLAEQLAHRPAFFDALLDHRERRLPSRESLAAELRDRVDAATPDGTERVLDALREFKEYHVFNVALAQVRGTLPLMNVSDYLTFLAEAVLEQALDIAWSENATRLGEYAWPQPFVIVGYGKLGGIELGPGSDLDLVFIHDLPGQASQFLHRLVRRLMHVITVPTYLGALYEVDMRLRPSGNSGLMVSTLESFRAYQEGEAWTWEHQALVRARALVGDAALGERFEAVRREILCLPRDGARLRDDVLRMRRRMAEQASAEGDLKRASGGMVDIEFMVQYLVLAHAHTHPELAIWSDNVRILETAGNLGLLSVEIAQALRAAYLALRAEGHRSALDLPDPARAAQVLEAHRDLVRRTWRALFGED
jgi:glutamate-ammonia-ligase adenylyltransferase